MYGGNGAGWGGVSVHFSLKAVWTGHLKFMWWLLMNLSLCEGFWFVYRGVSGEMSRCSEGYEVGYEQG